MFNVVWIFSGNRIHSSASPGADFGQTGQAGELPYESRR